MRDVKLPVLICLSFISLLVCVVQIQAQTKFTINRECDGSLCHFQIISFDYGRNSSISVGIGDSTLSYYFSVQTTNGKSSKEYIYSDEPNEHFVEKESGQKVDATLNKLLLDVYRLGNYIFENDIATRNKTFSETARFAVLTNLRNHINLATGATKQLKTKAAVFTQTLPVKVKSYLDKNYSGWKQTSIAKLCSSDFSLAVVAGDFDGDKKRDYAVKLIRGRKGYIIAFLERKINYEAHVLISDSAAGIQSIGLSISRKGEEYPVGGEYPDYILGKLPNDAPVIGECASHAGFYVYENGSFQ